MRPSHFIPPVAALILAGVCIGTQRRSMSVVEEENALLQKHITAARSLTTDDGTADGQPSGSAKLAKGKETLDWKKIAEQLAEMQRGGGTGDMRATLRLQKRLQEMSKEELVTALDEIAALEISDESRSMLEQMLIGPLVQKDPGFVLTKFSDRLDEPKIGWQLSNAMQQWAKKDPAKASAWFDQQIAAGKFDSKSLDGRSESRNQFEAALIPVLLESDVDAAARRLGAIPEDQRDNVLGHYPFQQLKEENQLAYAQLVRSQLPEKEQAGALARQASRLARGDGYANVTAYMDRIKATPAERVACVENAAEFQIQSVSNQKKVTLGDLDTMREWAAAQAPGTADRITGKALANSLQWGNKMNFTDAADLALHYHEASGNDDVLISFLENGGSHQNEEAARLLAAKISDDKRREKILENLE